MTPRTVDLGFLVPAALCWLGSLYCLSWLRHRPRDFAIAAIVVSFVARGAAFLVGAPTVYWAIDDLFGVSNVSRLIINVCGVVWSVSVLAALAYWNRSASMARRMTRQWSLAAVLIIVVTTGLWLRAEMPETATNFSSRHGHDLYVAAYMLIYHGSMTVGLAAVTVCSIRYGQLTNVTRLRWGMRATAVGALVYLTFCGHRIAVIVGRLSGWDAGVWAWASPLATGIGAVLMMVGLTMPMWGASITTMRAWRRAHVRYRQMTPLWDELLSITPAIALPVSVDSSLGIEFRLYRRMIEIRDGLLAISAHLPVENDADDSSDRMTTDPRRAAARIRCAVTAVRANDPPASETSGRQLSGSARHTEADWLAAVSVAYGRLALASRDECGRRTRPIALGALN